MNLEEEFDKRVEKNFDIKKKRIKIGRASCRERV